MARRFRKDTSKSSSWVASSASIRYCENSELVSTSGLSCKKLANQINNKKPPQKTTTKLTSLIIRRDGFMVTFAVTVKVFALELNAVLLEIDERR